MEKTGLYCFEHFTDHITDWNYTPKWVVTPGSGHGGLPFADAYRVACDWRASVKRACAGLHMKQRLIEVDTGEIIRPRHVGDSPWLK